MQRMKQRLCWFHLVSSQKQSADQQTQRWRAAAAGSDLRGALIGNNCELRPQNDVDASLPDSDVNKLRLTDGLSLFIGHDTRLERLKAVIGRKHTD